MADAVSQLIVRLIDHITGPARQAGRAIDNLTAKSRRAASVGPIGAVSPELPFAVRQLGTLAGAYVGVGTAVGAYNEYASFDRRMTRIGITADATTQQVKDASKAINTVTKETGLGTNAVVDGLDALVSAGRSLPEAMSFLPSVARTAQASGSAVDDIARTADAMGASMKISGDKMQTAFDILVAGGKAGKFELKDMASELPALAAAAGRVGMTGTDGLRQLVAMLQTIRNQTGSSGAAANAMANVFQKMESEETANKFKKFGINLRKEMERARKEGRNLLDFFLELSEQAVKGDLSKLPQLFSDAQMLQGMGALLSQRDALKLLREQLKDVDGTVLKDLGKVANDSAAATERLGNAWSNTMKAMGNTADALGATKALQGTADALDTFSSNLNRAMDAIRDKGLIDGIKEFGRQNELTPGTDAYQQKQLFDSMRELERKQALELKISQLKSDIDYRRGVFNATSERLKGRTDEHRPEIQRMKQKAEKELLAKEDELARMEATLASNAKSGAARSTAGKVGGDSGVGAKVSESLDPKEAAEMARTSMELYNQLLAIEGEKAVERAKQIGSQINGALSVTATPRINAPSVSGAGGGGGIGRMSGGGRTDAGKAYWVGEKGPEIFRPNTSGAITPSHAIGKQATYAPNINIVVNGARDTAALADEVMARLKTQTAADFRALQADAGLAFV